MTDHFAHLDDDLAGGTTTEDDAPKFPCEHCGGTGRWTGGRNQRGESKCFPCGGRGWFRASAHDRSKARASRRASKGRKIEKAREAFEEQHPGLVAELAALTDWNDFARSLVEQIATKGALTDPQVTAARNMLAKVTQSRAEQARAKAEREKDAPEVNLETIRGMFEAAASSGLKRPTYRAEGLVISRAPDHGKNVGCLYVRHGDIYQGKITPNNKFLATREASPEAAPALQLIAANPMEAAVRYGRLTGSCACCGRALTNKASVEAGIGPICATKYGF